MVPGSGTRLPLPVCLGCEAFSGFACVCPLGLGTTDPANQYHCTATGSRKRNAAILHLQRSRSSQGVWLPIKTVGRVFRFGRYCRIGHGKNGRHHRRFLMIMPVAYLCYSPMRFFLFPNVRHSRWSGRRMGVGTAHAIDPCRHSSCMHSVSTLVGNVRHVK